jgi:hypothetical protein
LSKKPIDVDVIDVDKNVDRINNIENQSVSWKDDPCRSQVTK